MTVHDRDCLAYVSPLCGFVSTRRIYLGLAQLLHRHPSLVAISLYRGCPFCVLWDRGACLLISLRACFLSVSWTPRPSAFGVSPWFPSRACRRRERRVCHPSHAFFQCVCITPTNTHAPPQFPFRLSVPILFRVLCLRPLPPL